MSGDVDAKAAAINEYGKLMLQHKVRAAHALARAPRAPHASRGPRLPLDLGSFFLGHPMTFH